MQATVTSCLRSDKQITRMPKYIWFKFSFHKVVFLRQNLNYSGEMVC